MSRSDDQKITDTAEDQNKTSYDKAQDAQTQAQQDTQNYRNTLGKYIADNPYTKGGEFDTSENQILANTADANSDAARDQLQTQAQRTGQNVNAANATAEEIAQQNERNLSGQSADATRTRIASKAGYDANGVQMGEFPAQEEASLYGTGIGAATGELNTAGAASANNKSFADQFGGAFATGFGSGLANEVNGEDATKLGSAALSSGGAAAGMI